MTTSPTQRRHEELVALLTEIRDSLPEPEGVNAERAEPLDVTRKPHKTHDHGIDPTCRERVGSDGLLRGECVDTAPDEDPDEARSYINGYHDGFSLSESAAEHWRAEFNQADRRIVGLTAERDEWQARHAALRADVERVRRNRTTFTDVLMRIADILDHDDERGEQG